MTGRRRWSTPARSTRGRPSAASATSGRRRRSSATWLADDAHRPAAQAWENDRHGGGPDPAYRRARPRHRSLRAAARRGARPLERRAPAGGAAAGRARQRRRRRRPRALRVRRLDRHRPLPPGAPAAGGRRRPPGPLWLLGAGASRLHRCRPDRRGHGLRRPGRGDRGAGGGGMRKAFAVGVLVAAVAVSVRAVSASADGPVPPLDGLMSFHSIQGPDGPEEFSWEVKFGEEEELRAIDDTHAGVYWVGTETLAMMITAQLAHDAEGA